MQPRISLITLGVSDLARATAFYEQGLGFPKMALQAPVSFFMLNGTWISLFDRQSLADDAHVESTGSGFRGFTLAHNVSSKAEVDAVMAQAAAAGARIVKPAQDVFWGGYSGYFADPDEYLWEVAWNPQFWPGPPE